MLPLALVASAHGAVRVLEQAVRAAVSRARAALTRTQVFLEYTQVAFIFAWGGPHAKTWTALALPLPTYLPTYPTYGKLKKKSRDG